jgi:hypothetical protein
MFHILGFQRENGKFVEAQEVKQFNISGESIRGFRLVEGGRYRLRVLEWCEPPLHSSPKSLKIKPEFRVEVMQLEGASDMVVGRYDVIELTFKALRPGYTELAIRAEPIAVAKPKDEAEEVLDWPSIFSVRVPVRVRNKISRVVAAGFVAAIGVLIYGLGPVYYPQYPELSKGIGLLLTFPILGEYLGRFVNYGESMRKFIKME